MSGNSASKPAALALVKRSTRLENVLPFHIFPKVMFNFPNGAKENRRGGIGPAGAGQTRGTQRSLQIMVAAGEFGGLNQVRFLCFGILLMFGTKRIT